MNSQIYLQNVKCNGCANSIVNRLAKIAGISNVHIEVEKAKLSFDCQNKAHILEVENALLAMGYPKVDDDNSLATKAKSFISCGIGKMSR